MLTLASACEAASEGEPSVEDPRLERHRCIEKQQLAGLIDVFRRAYCDHAQAVHEMDEATRRGEEDPTKEKVARVLDVLCRRALENAFVFASYLTHPADARMHMMAQVMVFNRNASPDHEGFSVASVAHVMRCPSWSLAKDASGLVHIVPSGQVVI